MQFKPMNIIASISAVLAVVGGVIAFDSRYAKEDAMVSFKNEIISEMRREVVKNRSVMISGMQREADDIEFQIAQLEAEGKPVPRYLSDKYKQILRQIETLKNENTN